MNKRIGYAGIAGILALALGIAFWPRATGFREAEQNEAAVAGVKEEQAANQVVLAPEALKAARIETAEVSERAATTLVAVTGTVEANQQKIQQATPLVSGRIERVDVVLGDRVKAGAVLAVISSPEVAEMHGKLHEAETRLNLAQQNMQRVQSAENRSAVIQAKARLDEADAGLRRTRRLIELGAAAGKDLTAAETGYTNARAEYDYQSNISLNREVQAARAEVELTQVEVTHLRDSLTALGATLAEAQSQRNSHDISIVTLRAPISGTVTERLVNAGAGIEPGKALLTIADISTLWVIANVPEGQIGQLSLGTPAEIRSPELGANGVAGRVAYIDPILNENTRTGRVRVEINNPGERLKVGMFVQVKLSAPPNLARDEKASSLAVPESAVQRLGDRSVVFIASGEKAGRFEVRDVELGNLSNGFHPVLNGIRAGESVVTRGSFTLKTQLMKGELGEAH